MGSKANGIVVVELGRFTNVDLFERGVYRIRARVKAEGAILLSSASLFEIKSDYFTYHGNFLGDTTVEAKDSALISKFVSPALICVYAYMRFDLSDHSPLSTEKNLLS
jgi:hypothetical protein